MIDSIDHSAMNESRPPQESLSDLINQYALLLKQECEAIEQADSDTTVPLASSDEIPQTVFDRQAVLRVITEKLSEQSGFTLQSVDLFEALHSGKTANEFLAEHEELAKVSGFLITLWSEHVIWTKRKQKLLDEHAHYIVDNATLGPETRKLDRADQERRRTRMLNEVVNEISKEVLRLIIQEMQDSVEFDCKKLLNQVKKKKDIEGQSIIASYRDEQLIVERLQKQLTQAGYQIRVFGSLVHAAPAGSSRLQSPQEGKRVAELMKAAITPSELAGLHFAVDNTLHHSPKGINTLPKRRTLKKQKEQIHKRLIEMIQLMTFADVIRLDKNGLGFIKNNVEPGTRHALIGKFNRRAKAEIQRIEDFDELRAMWGNHNLEDFKDVYGNKNNREYLRLKKDYEFKLKKLSKTA